MAKSLLLSPITIGKNTFKNRVFMSPMCMYNSPANSGYLDNFRFHHYLARAAGGVGAIVVEATAVQPETSITPSDLGLWNDEQAARFAQLVEQVHEYDCRIGIQLGHAGRKATGFATIYSASEVGAFDGGYLEPVALTTAEVYQFISDFGAAAKRAKKAGFDFVEIHGAHGYLVNQFISPITNKRDDEFGGSLENRYRLVKSLIQAVKENTDLDVHLRLSVNEIEEYGNQVEDVMQIAEWAVADGVVLIDVSSGGITTTPPQIFPGYQAQLSRRLSAKGIACGAVGLLGEPDLCEYILRSGDASVIYLGRPLLRNPNWVYEAAIKLHDEPKFAIPVYQRGFPVK